MQLDSKLCRLCAKSGNDMTTITLFERSQKATLRKIFQLTSIKLKNQNNIPTMMCADCNTELNRAYEFRERCVTAQSYFSSAEYKTICDQHIPKSKNCSKNQSVGTESTVVVKLERISTFNGNESKKVELQPERILKTSPNSEADVDSEFSALNEDEIDPAIYDDFEAESQDQSMLALPGETINESEIDLENPIEDNGRPQDIMSVQIDKVVKSEPKAKYNQKNNKINDNRIPKKERKPKKERENKERIYICDQCGNNFKYRNHFYSHIKRHTGIKPVQCEVCPDKFFTQGELKRHMRKHTGERPFACQYCQRRFTDYSTRVKHERTHTNERPFECTQCDKAFTTSYVLKNHMLVHTGERSFKCELCNKSFQTHNHLIVHTRSLTHKQNIGRDEEKLLQQGSDEIKSFPTQISATNT